MTTPAHTPSMPLPEQAAKARNAVQSTPAWVNRHDCDVRMHEVLGNPLEGALNLHCKAAGNVRCL